MDFYLSLRSYVSSSVNSAVCMYVCMYYTNTMSLCEYCKVTSSISDLSLNSHYCTVLYVFQLFTSAYSQVKQALPYCLTLSHCHHCIHLKKFKCMYVRHVIGSRVMKIFMTLFHEKTRHLLT